MMMWMVVLFLASVFLLIAIVGSSMAGYWLGCGMRERVCIHCPRAALENKNIR